MIPDRGNLRFSASQRSLVLQAMNEAEERTSGYYCFPPFRWEQLCYDLLTQEDHGWEPLPEVMLARVRRLERVNPRRPFDFYRIELNDSSILAAADRERLHENLYPFFVYILTHEMVHMVRLSSILGIASPDQEGEEERVQQISRRILDGSSHFKPILDKFAPTACASLEPASDLIRMHDQSSHFQRAR